MGIPAPSELILILLILVVIFGAKRIPEIMGGIGQGIKTFKKSMEPEEHPPPSETTQHPQQDSAEAKPPQQTDSKPDQK